MKKIYLIISIVIVVIILVSGSYLYLLYNEGISICKEASSGTAIIVGGAFVGIDNCNMIGSDEIRCKYLCIEYAASSQKSEILCERILQLNYTSVPNRPFYDECLKMVGSESADENTCNNIEDEEYRDECLLSVASSKKDEKMCEQISSNNIHDDCLYRIALVKRDSSICERIYDGKEKSDCNIMIEQIYP
jgi:hypothetical protein